MLASLELRWIQLPRTHDFALGPTVWNFRLLSESPGCLDANPVISEQLLRLFQANVRGWSKRTNGHFRVKLRHLAFG
jgi:hypothetical protein